MSLKFELEQWQAACVAFDNGDYHTSLQTFKSIAENAKMFFNIGLIFATEDEYDHAVAAYTKAITMDPYFAVAFFQRGVSHFIKNNMEAAKQDFDQAYQKLRGNQIINYQQLGLSFRLYACEVLFNRGICQLYMGKIDGGLTDLYHAQKARMTEEHDVIDQAVKDRGKGYSVFSIPPSVLFRPPENRLRQLQGTDMFAVVDQLAISQKKPIRRNNSILLPELRKKKSDASLLSKSSMASYGQPQSPLAHQQLQKQQIQQQQSLQLQMQHQYQQQQQQSCSPIERRRMDTGFSTYHSDDSGSNISLNSNYRVKQDGRRVDSGFESSHEERYSASSTSTGRSSTRSFKTNLYSPPPVPPIPPQHHFNTSEDYDLSSNSYGDFDQELEEVYGSLHTMSVQDREKDIIRSRLNSNNIGSSPMDRRESTGTNGSVGYPQPSVSTSTTGSRQSNQGKLKIKIHYTDTRILLVSSSIMFDELRQRVREKFGAPPSVRLQYKDEDSEMVLMIDDDDLYMARQISRNHNNSDTGIEKMEMWCVDAS